MEAKCSPSRESSYSKSIEFEAKHVDNDASSTAIQAESKHDSSSPRVERKPSVVDPPPVISVSENPRAQAIVEGFRITRMSMRDSDSGMCKVGWLIKVSKSKTGTL